MKVQIVNIGKHSLPKHQTSQSAGVDLHASIDGKLSIKPMGRVLVPTGIRIALPVGYEAQLRPRSGLALKYGISILNSPATIDSDYRGEIQVLLINLGDEDYIVSSGDRIAQLVLAKHETVEWEEVHELENTESRDHSGFGTTGT